MMRTVPRRRLSPQARRRELIEAAERVLRVKGPAGRVEDVTREALAAKGTFYAYFNTWEDMLLDLRARTLGAYDARFAAPHTLSDAAEWWQFLDRVMIGFVDFTVELGGIHEVIFHGPFAEQYPLSPNQNAPTALAKLLSVGVQLRACARLDPQPIARLLFSMAHCAADAICAGGDREQYVAALRTVLQRTLHHPTDP